MPLPPPPSARVGSPSARGGSPSARGGSLPSTVRSGRLDAGGITGLGTGQQSQAFQSLLRDIVEELASVRGLMQLQHEQILQRLPPVSSMLACNANQPFRQVDVFKPVMQPDATKLIQPSPNSQAGNVNQPPESQKPSNGRYLDESAEAQQAVEEELPKGVAATKSSSHGKGVLLDVSKLPQAWTVSTYKHEVSGRKRDAVHGYFKHLVKSEHFDAFFVSIIFVNLVTIAISLQWRGYYAAFTLGEREDDNAYNNSLWFFEILEWIYTTVFLVEAVLRITFLGREYFAVVTNVFDTLIVLVTCINTYLLQPLGLMKNASFVAVARLVRLVRVLRFLKVVRFAEACSELRILARALSGCAGSLFWSMTLLLALILAGAILISQITLPYIEDQDNPEEERRWSYERFGTVPLAMMALWECTFTGSWHRYSRRMIIHQNEYYAFFWVPYIVCVNFSVMRLIGALFLKETMAVASIDAEKMSMAKVKRQRQYAAAIHSIFEAADSSGDGQISADEFEAMLYNEEVGECFEKLELEVSEVAVLFELLASDDGVADYDEFLEGALKLKQTAQIIDIIQLMHDNQKHAEALQTVYLGVCHMANALGISLNKTALAKDLDPSDMRHTLVHGQTRSHLQHSGGEGHATQLMNKADSMADFGDLGGD